MPAQFDFQQFQAMTPLDSINIWAYLLDHNAHRITVKRRKPALDNLERIFKATFKLANEVGFRAMNLRDLCQETGLSMGGLYGYIRHKDQLAEMIEDVVRHATHEIPRLFEDVTDPLDLLEALMRASIFVSEILQPWFYFVFMDTRVLPAPQRISAKESELYVQRLFATVIARLPRHPDASVEGSVEGGVEVSEEVSEEVRVQLQAAHLMTVFQDWYVKRWKYRAANVSPDQFADSAVHLMRAYLAPKP